MNDNIKITLPRPYQQEAFERIIEAFENKLTAIVQFPTGGGSSSIVAALALHYSNNKILIITSATLGVKKYLLDNHNLSSEIYTSAPNKTRIIISTPQRLNSEPLNWKEIDLIINIGPAKGALLPNLTLLQDTATRYLLITPILIPDMKEKFGEPTFSYSLSQAIADNVFHRINFFHGPQLIKNKQLPIAQLDTLIEYIIDKNHKQEGSTLIICSSIDDANQIHSVLNKTLGHGSSILLHNQVKRVNENYQRFLESNTSIAISVNMVTGVHLAHLKNLILLREIKSEPLFYQIISIGLQPSSHKSHRNVWDFAGNFERFEKQLEPLINRYEDLRAVEALRQFEAHEDTKSNNTASQEHEANDKQKSPQENSKRNIQELAAPCNDKPSDKDLLGRIGLVNILKGVVDRNAREHLIIGLFGRWGTGKSTVINLLKHKYLQDSDTSIIVFNAWQEEHSSNMAASIASCIIHHLYSSKSFWTRLSLTLKERLIKAKGELATELIVFSVIFTCAPLLYFMSKGKTTPPLVFGASAILTLLTYSIKIYASKPFTQKIREFFKKPDFSKHIGLNYQIKNQLTRLISAYPTSLWRSLISSERWPIPKHHKYLIVIDDLDRCSDQKIIEVLEAVQLLIDIEGVSVILAVDHQVLLDAVAARYQKQRTQMGHEQAVAMARNFLGKILQLTISLDRPSEDSRNNFIHSRLYDEVPSQESKVEEPIKKVLDEEQKDFIDLATENFSLDDYYDDEVEEYDHSEEYLSNSYLEYEFFRKCSDVFKVHNPRTLIRLHNAISLLKGLYPSVKDKEQVLNQYIFTVFWLEKTATEKENKQRTLYDSLFDGKFEGAPKEIKELYKSIELPHVSIGEIKRIAYRVKQVSIPYKVPENTPVTQKSI